MASGPVIWGSYSRCRIGQIKLVAWVDLHRVDIGWLTRVFILWGSDVGPSGVLGRCLTSKAVG